MFALIYWKWSCSVSFAIIIILVYLLQSDDDAARCSLSVYIMVAVWFISIPGRWRPLVTGERDNSGSNHYIHSDFRRRSRNRLHSTLCIRACAHRAAQSYQFFSCQYSTLTGSDVARSATQRTNCAWHLWLLQITVTVSSEHVLQRSPCVSHPIYRERPVAFWALYCLLRKKSSGLRAINRLGIASDRLSLVVLVLYIYIYIYISVLQN